MKNVHAYARGTLQGDAHARFEAEDPVELWKCPTIPINRLHSSVLIMGYRSIGRFASN